MARGKGASDQRLLTPLRRRSPDAGAIAGDRRMNSNSRILYVFLQQKMLGHHSGAMFLFTLSYPSHLKHTVLRAFLEDGLPEMLSKLCVFAERGITK